MKIGDKVVIYKEAIIEGFEQSSIFGKVMVKLRWQDGYATVPEEYLEKAEVFHD